MSREIDQRVVEMQFDNRHFERNVSTTMSTLDKLKRSLNMDGAAKGLHSVNAAARGVNMTPLASGIETVQMKFSALQVVGVTALANITNSAVNAGKRIVSALTIDPIKTGFQEYETQINSVQTILANTESKGSTLEDVNAALKQLNAYADKTIYNFTEMTRNIGTFTAAGIDLDTSVNAIQGIANLAAVSGSTSQQASTAMYQLSQALASGTVKLMDWNSVVNAGMGGQVFQDALKETARIHGVAIDSMIESEGSFRETLSQGWLTADILTETLMKFTMATEGLTETEIEANREKLRTIGYTEDQIEAIFKLGNTATNAATKVKTFTQLWDVLKEAAQSGWAQTWQLIVGDFEGAKALFTPLSDFLTGVINTISEARNKLLENALTKGFTDLLGKVNNAFSFTQESIASVVGSLEDLDEIATRVIRGDFANNPDRFDKVTEAGYNYYRVQNRVNEMLGDTFRHSEEVCAAQDKLLGKTKETTTATGKLTDEGKRRLKLLVKEEEAVLRAVGYSEHQIEVLREIEAQAKKLGLSTDDLIDNLDQINGRWLLINSFKNMGQGIVATFTAIGQAWREIFDPITAEHLFNAIAGFHKLTTYLMVNEEAADKIKRTFKGVFALLDIVVTLIGGPLKIAFKAFTQLLGVFNIDILDFTAMLGDGLVKLRDWIDGVLDFSKIFEAMKAGIMVGVDAFRTWIDTLKDSENLPKDIADGIINGISKSIDFVKEKIKGFFAALADGPDAFTIGNIDIGKFLSTMRSYFSIVGQVAAELGKIILNKINSVLTAKGFKPISLDMIAGLIDGLKAGGQKLWDTVINIGKTIIEKIKAVLDINSPSKVFFAIGGFIIAGLIGGLLAGSGDIAAIATTIGNKLTEFFGGIDLGTVFAGVLSAGLLKGFLDIASGVKGVGSMFGGVGDVLGGVGKILETSAKAIAKTVTNFGKMLSAAANQMNAEAIKNIAISIAILVGAVVVLSFIDPGKLWASIGALTVLMILLGGLFAAINFAAGGKKANPKDLLENFASIIQMSTLITALGTSFLLMAISMKILESIDVGKWPGIIDGFTMMIMAIAGLLVAYGLCVKGESAQNIGRMGKMFQGLAKSLLLMSIVVWILGSMNGDKLKQGITVMGLFAAVMALFMVISRFAGPNVGDIGKTMKGIAAAMLTMTIVVLILGLMNPTVLQQGMDCVTMFAAIIMILIASTKLAGGNLDKLGSTLFGIAAAMLVMGLVVKLLGGMEIGALIKGVAAVAAFGLLIAGLIWILSKYPEKELKGIALTLIGLSVAIGIMAAVCVILGLLDPGIVWRGFAVVAALGALVAGLILATSKAKDCHKNLLMMAIVIGILAASIAILSFLKPEKVVVAAACMAAVMGMFALMINQTKNLKKASKGLGVMITMVVAIVAIAAVLAVLANMPVDGMLAGAISLSLLMAVMTGIIAVLSKINAANALIGVIALLAMAIPLIAFVGVLAVMQHVQNAMNNVLALVTLTAALTVLLIPLALVGTLALNALIGVGLLLLMAVPLLAFVGILYLMDGLQNATQNVGLLVVLMGAMTVMLVVLGVLGPLITIGVVALAGLVGLIAAVAVLATALGALTTYFPDLETFLNKGIDLMCGIAEGLGRMIGSFVTGLVDTVIQSLPGLGTALSEFITNAGTFITNIKDVDDTVLAGVTNIAAAILLLTAADLIDGLASFINGGSSFSTLGTDLSDFATNASGFFDAMKGVDPNIGTVTESLAKAILALTASNLLNSVTDFLGGDTSYTEFGEALGVLGEGIKSFSDSVSGGIDTEAVTAASAALKEIAGAAKEVPNSGGLLGDIFGENDVDTFGTKLVTLGTSLQSFSASVSANGGIDREAITSAAEATKEFANVAKDIPNSGGLWGELWGDNSLDKFGEQLASFGTGIKSFSDTVSTNGGIDYKAMESAAKAGSLLADIWSTLPEIGGVEGALEGDEDIAAFCETFKSFGDAAKYYSNQVESVNATKVNYVTSLIRNALRLAQDLKALDTFTVKNAFRDIATYGIEAFTGEFTADATSKSLTSAVQTMVNNAAVGVNSKASTFKSAGKTAVVKFAAGIKDGATDAKTAVTEMMSDMEGAVNDYEDDFYSVGSDIVAGVASGIYDNQYKVILQATTMATAALNAAKIALGINSPSKEFYAAGEFSVIGFVNAFTHNAKRVYNTAYDMADSAKLGLGDAISRIASFVDNNIDSQPTISPVLDLSNIESGVGAINGMFGRSSIGVSTNLGAITSMMNHRNQNGANSDMVSAIKDLRGELHNVRGNSYNINGITYSGESDLADAIETIIRVANIERRR